MIPFYVNNGAVAGALSGNLTVPLPTGTLGYLAGDLFIVAVETNNEAITAPGGWTEATGSPVANAGANPTRISVLYKRAASNSESAPTITGVSDHMIGRMLVIRGAIESGDPFDVTSTATGTGTSISIPGATTTANECLIVAMVATTLDAGGTNLSGIANGDLADVAERFDSQLDFGSGGGVAAFTGEKATAGAFGATTATAGSAEEWAGWLGAVLPATTQRPHALITQGSGNNTGDATVTFQNNVIRAGDIIVCGVESNNEAVTAPTDYTEAGSSPLSNSGTNATRLTVFWKRAVGGETNVVVPDSGDHQCAQMMAFRNCVVTGNPFNVTSGTNGGTGTSITIPGATTTDNNCLIVAIAGSTRDVEVGSAVTVGTWANASLSDVKEWLNLTRDTGTGGGTSAMFGFKAAAGAYGNSTATHPSSAEWTGWTGALTSIVPSTYQLICEAGSYSHTGSTVALKKAWKLYTVLGTYAITGKTATLFYNASEIFTLSFLTTLLPAVSANTITYHPKLTVDGSTYPIISWTFREEAQSLTGTLDVQLLRDTDREFITKDSEITFELGTEIDGVTTYETLVDTGQLEHTDYHISRDGIGPNDSFTITVKPLLLKRLQTTALNGIVLYDPQKHEIDEANWPVIYSTTGAAYTPYFEQIQGMTFYNVLYAAAASLCGFSSVHTNIPNFYVGMAQFNAGEPVMNVLGGLVGMFEPDFSTNEGYFGTELYVRDGTTGIVEGLPEPRQIGVSNARQIDVAADHNRVDAMLITYLADNRTYDTTAMRVDTSLEESGEGEGFTSVTTTKTYVDFFRNSQPDVPVRTEHISTDVDVYQNVKTWSRVQIGSNPTVYVLTPSWSLELTQTVNEAFYYNSRGLFYKRLKQEYNRLPIEDGDSGEFATGFTLTLDEVETISYFTHPYKPMRVYPAKHVILTNGLIYVDIDEPQLTEAYSNAAVKVFKAGNVKTGMSSFFGAMRTLVETGVPLRNGKVRFRTIEIDQATGNVNSHFEEERDGDLGTPSHVHEPRQAYVLLTDDAIRTTDPVQELQTGEIGAYLAVALARRKLIQANVYPNLLSMDYIGIDTTLAKGTPVNARGRNNEDLGNYIIEARAMQGSREGHFMNFEVRQAA